jgi:transcriptional regulator with GAF, ATPase, and Fis domain
MVSRVDDLQTQLLKQEGVVPCRSIGLLVIDGADRGRRTTVPPSGLRIGTAPSAHFQLTDPSVSRLHCELEWLPEGLRVVDSGSTNGTHVDGVRVRDADVVAGSTLRLGATSVQLVGGDAPMVLPVSERDRLGSMVGASVEMRRVYALVERLAPTQMTVLVQGDTGTGKELVARAIHDFSPRARHPFVAVDCGAIAPNVIESELFGHVRGAFSGAVSDRRGLFEEADGGTLFLDEIGELPLALQAKLLRALETREIRRVGGNSAKRVDVRLIAATNRGLARSVNDGSFREELYYRLAVGEIHLPPLHARRGDIPLLAQHFYGEFAGGDGAIPEGLLSALLTRSWPGNVRELRNFIERCVSLGWEGIGPVKVSPDVVPGLEALIPLDRPMKDARQAWMDQFERGYVSGQLRKTGGNVTRAAEAAGVSRRFFQRAMARLGMRSLDVDADTDGES